ncbi:hypothetical protein CYCD_24680 [Tenuifilaceae bacterium CYCD]|nr:hypothetical protein CYCD_24680 [Tenuifilaceae bacterium CYCD]
MKPQNRCIVDFVVNNLLIITGAATIVSGFVLQLGFHIGNTNRHYEHNTPDVEPLIDTSSTVWGIDYATWSAIHKVVIVLLLFLMVYHIAIHWKWYRGVLARHLVRKNQQVIVLSFLFILVALTGLIPWFIDLLGNRNFLRLILIEIHDKISILLIIYLILHVVKRAKWFLSTLGKVRSKE